MSDTTTLIGALLALISAACYSSMYILVRRGIRPGDLDGGALVTTICNSVLFGLIALAVAVSGLPPDWDPLAVFWFAVAGFLGTGAGRLLMFAGIRRIGPVRTSAVANTAPLVTIVLAIGVLGEQLSPGAVVAVVLVLIGLAILTWEGFRSSDPPASPTDAEVLALPADIPASGVAVVSTRRQRAMDGLRHQAGRPAMLGLFLAALSAASFGSGRLFRRLGIDLMNEPVIGAMIGAWVALVCTLAVHAHRRQARAAIVEALGEFRPQLWVAGALSTAGLLTFFLAIQRAPLSHVAVIAASETLITLLMGAIFLRQTERLSLHVIVPSVTIFAGGVLIAVS